jgi:hypothetical protein
MSNAMGIRHKGYSLLCALSMSHAMLDKQGRAPLRALLFALPASYPSCAPPCPALELQTCRNQSPMPHERNLTRHKRCLVTQFSVKEIAKHIRDPDIEPCCHMSILRIILKHHSCLFMQRNMFCNFVDFCQSKMSSKTVRSSSVGACSNMSTPDALTSALKRGLLCHKLINFLAQLVQLLFVVFHLLLQFEWSNNFLNGLTRKIRMLINYQELKIQHPNSWQQLFCPTFWRTLYLWSSHELASDWLGTTKTSSA